MVITTITVRQSQGLVLDHTGSVDDLFEELTTRGSIALERLEAVQNSPSGDIVRAAVSPAIIYTASYDHNGDTYSFGTEVEWISALSRATTDARERGVSQIAVSMPGVTTKFAIEFCRRLVDRYNRDSQSKRG